MAFIISQEFVTLEISTVSHFFLRENYLNKNLEGKDAKTLPLRRICCRADSSPAFG